ncbi:MAG: response regulator [Cytophagaceae bacterium]|jgi:DNA-binding NtrC family response regulator|nr:response regulator [Cytophagaceae bacterium]
MEHNVYDVFIVDRDIAHAASIRDHMHTHKQCRFHLYSNAEDCLNQMHVKPALVFLDYELQPNDTSYQSTEILKKIKASSPGTEVVLFTGFETVEVIKDTLHHGAYDYFVKDHLSHVKAELLIERLLDVYESRDEFHKFKKYTRILIGGLLIFSIAIVVLYIIGWITDNVGGWMF